MLSYGKNHHSLLIAVSIASSHFSVGYADILIVSSSLKKPNTTLNDPFKPFFVQKYYNTFLGRRSGKCERIISFWNNLSLQAMKNPISQSISYHVYAICN
jgi:hypothetical protein